MAGNFKQKRTFKTVMGGLFGFLGMSVIAGILATISLIPVIGVAGNAAASGINLFENLPDYVNPKQIALPSHIYAKDKDGKRVELAQFYAQNRIMKGWDDISQFAKDAAVAEEDWRFYEHSGVDIKSIARALVSNSRGSQTSGASTITMQYVKNVLVQQAELIPDEKERQKEYEEATRQDLDRKLKEMRIAIGLEKKYSKNDILVGYLNIANYGGQIYGIEAAAKRYFNVSAKDLTLPQAASLVGIVNYPGALNLSNPKNYQANKERRDVILKAMLDHGKINREQFDKAVATPIEVKLTTPETGCEKANDRGLGHFCNYVVLYIMNDPKFGNTPSERYYNFQHGGLNIDTTVDLDMQAAGVEAMKFVPAQVPGIDLGSASISLQIGTGRVLSMVQNRAFSEDPDELKENTKLTSINYNTDIEYGGSSGFQYGSQAKAFTLAEWLKEGHSPSEQVWYGAGWANMQDFKGHCFKDGVYAKGGGFTFTNWGYQAGTGTVQYSMDQSLNGGLVSMAKKLDLCNIFETAQNMGLQRATTQEWDKSLSNYGTRNLTMVPSGVYNGNDEVSPSRVAMSYSGFGGQGQVCTPVPIDAITNGFGQDVPFSHSECKQGMDREVAKGVTKVLEGGAQTGLAKVARSAIGTPHYAKTGTTDNTADHWISGGSSKVVTTAWIGNVTGKAELGYGPYFDAPARLFTAQMNVADKKYGGDPFPEAHIVSQQQTADKPVFVVPNVNGQQRSQADSFLTTAGFSVKIVTEDSTLPKDTVIRSAPAANGQLPQGGTVTLYISTGIPPKPKVEKKKVPDGVVGRSAAEAGGILRGSGFSELFMTCSTGSGSPNPNGSQKVVSLSPASGAEVEANSRVTLSVECQ